MYVFLYVDVIMGIYLSYRKISLKAITNKNFSRSKF